MFIEIREVNFMKEKLTKNDFREIYSHCYEVFRGNVQDEPLEDRILREYDAFGAYYVMPWAFESIERGMNITKVLEITFPEGEDEIDQDTLAHQVHAWRTYGMKEVDVVEEDEEETIEISGIKDFTPPPLTPKKERKPRQKSSESLTGRAQPIYERLYQENPEIRNADAQRAIAAELGIEDNKQLNSLRALVVKFKKNLS